MGKKIVVIGAGLIGKAIAIDLKKSGYDVTSSDISMDALAPLESKHQIAIRQCDITDSSQLADLVSGQDLVIGAAPGALGYGIMKRVIEFGKNMVDISFCPEDFMDLDQLAKDKNVTVVADMGVAPGMCNAILGYHDRLMKVNSYKCVVGGLPVKREWPLEYKSSWSPIDCIEEYVRPARIMQNGKLIEKPALSDVELIDFEETGTLEEWNSDGLRSLLTTMSHIPDMLEKTLRYPGTINYVRVLRELGFFRYDEVEVQGKMVRPIDLTASLLFPTWKLEKGEREFTIMRVTIEGEEKEETKRYVYDLYDEYDPENNTLSMSRTTGYTCTGTAEMILKGMVKEKGVIPPEMIGANPKNFKYLMEYLRARNVVYRVSEE